MKKVVCWCLVFMMKLSVLIMCVCVCLMSRVRCLSLIVRVCLLCVFSMRWII